MWRAAKPVSSSALPYRVMDSDSPRESASAQAALLTHACISHVAASCIGAPRCGARSGAARRAPGQPGARAPGLGGSRSNAAARAPRGRRPCSSASCTSAHSPSSSSARAVARTSLRACMLHTVRSDHALRYAGHLTHNDVLYPSQISFFARQPLQYTGRTCVSIMKVACAIHEMECCTNEKHEEGCSPVNSGLELFGSAQDRKQGVCWQQRVGQG